MYELIQLPEEGVDGTELDIVELKQLQRQKYANALKNLVTGKTPPSDFQNGRIPRRPARGGTEVDYIPGWWFIEQANALFGHLWNFEVLEQDIGKGQIWVKGCVTVTMPGRTVARNLPDGSVEEVKYDTIQVSKTQFGGADIKKKQGSEAPIDVGDDLKAAATDCMKKCLVSFGFAPDVYGKREILEATGASRDQLDAVYSKAEEVRGWSKDKVDEYCASKHNGKGPKELDMLDALGLLNEMRQPE